MTDDQANTPALPATTHVVLDAQVLGPPRAAGDMSDAELGAEAAACVDRSLSMREGAIEQATRAGELLRAAKDRCRAQGASWTAWCARHWPKSRRTADTYIAVAMEVTPAISGGRAPRSLLDLPSVRAVLTDAGISAGGTRGAIEDREPGADEDEDLVPGPDGRLITAGERARLDALATAEQRASDQRDADRRQRREDWKAQKREDERKALDNEEAARRAASAAEEARKRTEREADLAAIKQAEQRPNGPDPLPKRPVVPDEVLSAAEDVAAMEQMTLALQRRFRSMRLEPAPAETDSRGYAVMHQRDQERSFVEEWINAGTQAIRHMQAMAEHDAKVVKAAKKARGLK